MLRVIFLLFISFFSYSGLYAESNSCENYHCLAVVDAGSTGSRLHVFSYDLDETNTATNIKEIWSKKIKPGFASIEPNSKEIDGYLKSLLQDAPISSTPLYFYATAGMRLQPQARQKLYYKILKQWFEHQSQWQLKDAKTITGKEEGVYDWLSTNYELGALSAHPKQKPVGVMDFGGASVQIVFPVDNDPGIQSNDKIDLKLNGKKQSLFVHSFLGLGQTEVTHQYLDSSACFSNDYPMPDGSTAQGDATTCEHEVSSLMNDVHGVNRIVQPVLQANPVDNWYVLGSIVYMAQDKLYHFSGNKISNQNLLKETDRTVCHQTWDVLSEKYPSNDYLYGYCLYSAYFYALMVDGYGLQPEKELNYLSKESDSDWTLGVVIHP